MRPTLMSRYGESWERHTGLRVELYYAQVDDGKRMSLISFNIQSMEDLTKFSTQSI
jgi:hypothetical protein